MTGIWKFLLFLSITPAIYAQYGGNSSPTSSSAASSTTSSSATTAAPSQSGVRDVNVGQNGRLTFSPDTLAAAVGDKVNFHFFSLNHSVVQSSFNNPCQPIDNGIFSGFMPVNSGEAVWSIYTNHKSRKIMMKAIY
jgi:plastocyanin